MSLFNFSRLLLTAHTDTVIQKKNDLKPGSKNSILRNVI